MKISNSNNQKLVSISDILSRKKDLSKILPKTTSILNTFGMVNVTTKSTGILSVFDSVKEDKITSKLSILSAKYTVVKN